MTVKKETVACFFMGCWELWHTWSFFRGRVYNAVFCSVISFRRPSASTCHIKAAARTTEGTRVEQEKHWWYERNRYEEQIASPNIGPDKAGLRCKHESEREIKMDFCSSKKKTALKQQKGAIY